MKRLSSLFAATACSAAVLVSAGQASAHHSFAMFDRAAITQVTGTVKEVQWANPHVWIQLVSNDEKTGVPVEWSIEGGSINMLEREGGWKRSTLQIGDKVTIYMHPLLDHKPGGELVNAMVKGKLVGSAPVK